MPSVLTIGNFDALHLGHRALLSRVAAEPLRRVVVTFDPQPSEVLSPAPPARLLRLREKWTKLQAWPIDLVYMLPFSAVLGEMSAEAFMENILLKGLCAQKIIVGEDFRFGKDRQGDVSLLSRYGFDVEIQDEQRYQGRTVSSSWIRELLWQGDFALAETLLGEPYYHMGHVIYGNQLGRQLGCPTANIAVHRKTCPLQGVYVVEVEGIGPGVASIGTRPAVGGKTFLLEVHLFDFSDNIYGRLLKVRYLKKLRDEWMFDSLEALKHQIEQDCQQAREYWNERL